MRNRNFVRITIEVPVLHVHYYDPAAKEEKEEDVTAVPEGVAVISMKEVRREVKHLRMPIGVFIENAQEYTPAERPKKPGGKK